MILILKCCVGKNGLNYNKKEIDNSTPKGLFNLKKLYFRKDRVEYPKCKLIKKLLKMIWLGVMILTTKNTMKKLNHIIKD